MHEYSEMTSNDSCMSTLPSLPNVVDKHFQSVIRGPTKESNWLIPEKVSIGEVPGGYDRNPKIDINKILNAGVNVFVSLLEYKPSYVDLLRQKQYGNVRRLAFSINDFKIADDKKTAEFVEELARVVRTPGNVIYLHCFSGRNRTDTIAIPLLLALYSDKNMSLSEATHIANAYKSAGQTGRTKGGHMPEIDMQHHQMKYNVVAYKRGGHKAKHK